MRRVGFSLFLAASTTANPSSADPPPLPAPAPPPPDASATLPEAPPAPTPAPALAVPPARKKHRVYGSSPEDIGERATTWDLNVEGAYGRAFGNVDRMTGFGRIRGGILRVREPWFFALGATYEISDLTPATFGLQGEAMHLGT